MSIYRITKYERDEWRGQRRLQRLRLAALILSGLLIVGTAALGLARWLTKPAPVVSVPVVRMIEGAAAAVPK